MRKAYKISGHKSHMIRVLVSDPVGGKVINIAVDRIHILFAAMIWPELDEERDV